MGGEYLHTYRRMTLEHCRCPLEHPGGEGMDIEKLLGSKVIKGRAAIKDTGEIYPQRRRHGGSCRYGPAGTQGQEPSGSCKITCGVDYLRAQRGVSTEQGAIYIT